MPKQRIGYIDALRGLTMLLVVYSHVEFYCYNVSFKHTIFGMLFVHFRMPMFFFISGFIAYKAIYYDWKTYGNIIKKKAIVQIIPTLFFFHLLYVAMQQKPIDLILTKGLGGYWFTIALFYMFVIYFTTRLLTRNMKSYVQDIILVVIAITLAIIYGIGIREGNPTWNIHPIICFDNLSKYFEFFVLGILCRKHWQKFEKFISHDATKTLLLIGFAASSIVVWHFRLNKSSLAIMINYEFLVRYLGLLFVFAMFHNYRNFFNTNNRIANAMRYTGRHTLDIYMLHYFLLPKIPMLHSWAFQNNMIVLEFTVTILLSILIIAGTLLISKVIRTSNFLGKYLLGAKQNKENT